MWRTTVIACCLIAMSPLAAGQQVQKDSGFVALFPKEGVPEGWKATLWSDVSKPPAEGIKWTVKDGILQASEGRGSWLVSEREYGDFILEFEFKLGPRGNSGCGIRIPPAGDPAFDGLEIQMCDARYNEPPDTPDKLTASLYWAIAPTKQVYKPEEWNSYRITAQGPRIRVELNGEVVQDVNLDEHSKPLVQQGNRPAKALKDRPRQGRIGFQELSRGGGHVMIRGARIKVLD